MAAGQPLRGFVGQSMSGRRPSTAGYAYQYPPGSYVFTPPVSGIWTVIQWGKGGAISAAASGAYTEITRPLTPGQPVSLNVGGMTVGGDTTASFSDGRLVSAGAASGATPGVASGGDVNLNGSAPGAAGLGTGGGAASQGAGAPANLPFRGGSGGANGFLGGTPGGGSGTLVTPWGGDGQTIIFLASS